MEFAEATPTLMMAPISEGMEKRRLGDEQAGDDAAEGERQGQQHHERIAPGLEVHHHQQVDGDHRDREADADAGKAWSLLWIWPRTVILSGAWSCFCGLGHDAVDVALDAAEVAVLHGGVDVVGRLGVDVVGHGLLAAAASAWRRSTAGCTGALARGRRRGDEQRRVAAAPSRLSLRYSGVCTQTW